MRKRSCPTCNRKLPYAARRCLHCGWSHAGGGAPVRGPSFWSRARIRLLVLLLAGAIGGGLVYRNADALAFWYAGFAAHYLPPALSSFAPTDTDAGAFFYCARQVARRMDGQFSVETFPTLEQSRAVVLPDGRYRIESFVDEMREDGARVRHAFICTVHHAHGRWMLDQLELSRGA